MPTKEFEIPLVLVTPHMTGQKVRDAQYLMAGHSRFKGLATYKDGKLDGDYGALSAQATKRTKWYLGYPEKACDGVFGQTLYEYLNPQIAKELPTAYKTRRTQRLKAVAESPGKKALDLAMQDIGYKEEPRHGVNDNKYGREYGFNFVPWCAIFESIKMKHAGFPFFRYAAVEAIYHDAVANRNRLHIVRTPQAGDIIGYKFHGDPFAHTAFFVRMKGTQTLIDLGGNTGPANFSNGGMVAKQERSITLVSFYARVT